MTPSDQTDPRGRHLVTTALEETWPDEGGVIFLGEWCRRFSRRHVWSVMDADVIPYHWNDRSTLDADHQRLTSSHTGVLRTLGHGLNEVHGTAHGERYWRLLIGPWLTRSLHMAFDRWRSVVAGLERQDVVSTTILDIGGETLVAPDLESFLRRATTDLGNHAFFSLVLENMGVDSRLEIHRQPVAEEVVLPERPLASPTRRGVRHFDSAIQRRIWSAWSTLGARFVRPDDVLIYGTRLSNVGEAGVARRLGQFPQVWTEAPSAPAVPVDPGLRAHLAELVGVGADDEFEAVFGRLVCHLLPTVYLEGYDWLVTASAETGWPTAPSAIWTNREWRDEVFKAYSAEKVESGTQFVMSQNSGGYGMFPWDTYEENERSVSDRYLTWGWTDSDDPSVRPVGAVRTKPPVGVDHEEQDRALLVTVAFDSPVQMMVPMVNSSAWLYYFADLVRFARSLDDEVRRSLLVRLYRADGGWDQIGRWSDAVPEVELDHGLRPIEENLRQTRLLISSYNGANNLEAVAMGVPTVMFWDPLWWPLRDEAAPYFRALRDVGVFHETPESAAAHVVDVWDDVGGWWRSPDVVDAIRNFSDRFISTKPGLSRRTADEIRGATAEATVRD